jgi:PAS domain S-box-containing protein
MPVVAMPPHENPAAPTGVAYIDAETRIAFANAEFMRLAVVRFAEWRGRPLQQVLPEPVFAMLCPQLDTAMRGTRVTFEPVLPMPAGGARAIDAAFEPEVGPDGATVGVIAILRDASAAASRALAQAAREERYVDLFENAGEALYTLDLAGDVTAVNRAMAALSGYSRTELMGTSIARLVAPEHLPRLQQNLLGKAAGQPVTSYTLDIVTKAGERRNVIVSSRFIISGGRAVGVQGSVRDITDVERQEQRLRLVVEHLPVGVWLVDPEGRILLDNPEGERIWGRRFRERDHEGAAAGRDVASGRALSGASWSLSRALASGEPVLDEVIEIGGADGAARTIVSSVIPLRHRNGPVYGAVVVNDDVTTLRRLERRLQEGEERLTLAQRAGGIGTFEWFIVENRIIWTPELEALYGLPPGGFEGSYEHWAKRVHPDDLPATETRLWGAVRGGPPYYAQFRAIRPDGSERWLQAAGDLHRDVNGAPSRIVGVNIDVTDRVRLEQEREAALTQLRDQIAVHVELNAELRATAESRDAALREAQAALQVRDEFLSSVSHDLRTPLTVLKGLTQLLQRRAGRGPIAEGSGLVRQLETMEAAVDRMAGLVDDLLDLSRLESGRALELALTDCDLVGLAQAVASEHQRASQRHRIVVEAGASSLLGQWDGSRLERVLSNVIGNAVRYSPEGGEIVVSLRESTDRVAERWAEVQVQDHGVGIPAADLPHVLERFHRGSNVAGLIKGTGVGLATVKQVIEQHGGSVTMESEVGKGTTVTIRLPIVS